MKLVYWVELSKAEHKEEDEDEMRRDKSKDTME